MESSSRRQQAVRAVKLLPSVESEKTNEEAKLLEIQRLYLAFKIQFLANKLAACPDVGRVGPSYERDTFDSEYQPEDSDSSEDDVSEDERFQSRGINSHAQTKRPSTPSHSNILGIPKNNPKKTPRTKLTRASISNEQSVTESRRPPSEVKEDWTRRLERDGYVLISGPAAEQRTQDPTGTNITRVAKSCKFAKEALCNKKSTGNGDRDRGNDSRFVNPSQTQRTDTYKGHRSPLKTQKEAYHQYLTSAPGDSAKDNSHAYQPSKAPLKGSEPRLVAGGQITDLVNTSTRDSSSQNIARAESTMSQIGYSASYDQHSANMVQRFESLARTRQELPEIHDVRGGPTVTASSMPSQSLGLTNEIMPWAIQLIELVARACVSELEKRPFVTQSMAYFRGLQGQAVTDPTEEIPTAPMVPEDWQTQEALGLHDGDQNVSDNAITAKDMDPRKSPKLSRKVPRRSSKATTAKKQSRRDYPKLSRKVPRAERCNSQELITVGRTVNAYQRHWQAPYAFSRRGHLRAKYHYLVDSVDAKGCKWSGKETARVFASNKPCGLTFMELEGRASSMEL